MEFFFKKPKCTNFDNTRIKFPVSKYLPIALKNILNPNVKIIIL